jgi:hypothetical protein
MLIALLTTLLTALLTDMLTALLTALLIALLTAAKITALAIFPPVPPVYHYLMDTFEITKIA